MRQSDPGFEEGVIELGQEHCGKLPRPGLFEMLRPKLTLSVIGVFFTLVLFGQAGGHDRGRFYAPDSLKSDLRFFHRRLDAIHSGLYRYTSGAELAGLFDSLGRVIRRPMNEQEFLSLLMLVQARIRNGHTMVLPGEGSMADLRANGRLLPFDFRLIDNKIYIKRNYSDDSSIRPGSEVVQINEIAATAVQMQLMSRLVRDGYNQTYPVWILDHYFSSYYSFVFGQPGEFRLELNEGNGKKFLKEVRALTLDSIAYFRQSRYDKRGDLDTPITFRQLSGHKIAVLIIRTFDSDLLTGRYMQNYPTVIDDIFRRLRQNKDTALILDLRDNQGGDFATPRYLLARLVSKPTQFLMGGPESELVRPVQDYFSGRLIVLVNGGSFSSTAILASTLERDMRATFIGEETGGNATIISGDPDEVVLPHTKISCYISTKTYRIRERVNNGRGLIPRFVVRPDVADFLSDRDPVMEFALSFIEGVVRTN